MAPAASARALLAAAVGLIAAGARDVELPTFEEYARAQGLSHPPSEQAERKAIYEANLREIQAQNAKEGRLWTAAVNHLTGLTKAEREQFKGYMKTTGPKPGASPPRHASRTVPPRKDWREAAPAVVTPVKNQGSCGSCWAFASSAVIESAIAIATGYLFEVSPQKINSCAPNPLECGGSGGCTGSTPQLAFNYTIAAGASSLWGWPYVSGITHNQEECYSSTGPKQRVAGITGYYQLPQNDADALIQAVLVSPVALSVAAGDWWKYHSGIFDGCNRTNPIVDHAVVLNGYGVEGVIAYWLVRNSWGEGWGEFGHIRIQRFPEGEPWGLDNEPLDGYACKGNAPESIRVRGMCGILSDSAYPTGGYKGSALPLPDDPAINRTKVEVAPHSFVAGMPEGADGAAFLQVPGGVRREL